MKSLISFLVALPLILVASYSALAASPSISLYDAHYPNRTDGIVCGFYVKGANYSVGYVLTETVIGGHISSSYLTKVSKNGTWKTPVLYPIAVGKMAVHVTSATTNRTFYIYSACTDASQNIAPATPSITLPPTDTK